MEILSNVQQFYFGKNVFITGATGFLGKLVVEKLLRSCPGKGKLYLLMRGRKGKDIYTRCNEVFDDPVFLRLKHEDPDFRQRIVLIAGDCAKPNLGLSENDMKILLKQVNIIFHLAATVRFNEHLRVALDINVKATLDLLRLAKIMQNLDVFMHVSTAYSMLQVPVIQEEFYDMKINYSQLQEIMSNLTDKEIRRILPTILGLWPNTYTFTKALTENEIQSNCGDLPVGVFRPAIVTSTANEPIKAWIDNMLGPMGFVVGYSTGVLHTSHCDPDVSANLVPADYVVNCLIAAALDVHTAYKQNISYQPPIYNYVSSVENRITWAKFLAYCEADTIENPLSNAIWYPSLILNKYAALNHLDTVFLHFVPALFMDIIMLIHLRRPKMLKMYIKMHNFLSIFVYFTTKDRKFCNKRTRELWKNCSDGDKQLFPFSMAEFNWNEYFTGYVLGVRRYLLKQTDEQLPQARKKYKRFYYLHNAFKICISFLLLYIIYLILSKVCF